MQNELQDQQQQYQQHYQHHRLPLGFVAALVIGKWYTARIVKCGVLFVIAVVAAKSDAKELPENALNAGEDKRFTGPRLNKT